MNYFCIGFYTENVEKKISTKKKLLTQEIMSGKIKTEN